MERREEGRKESRRRGKEEERMTWIYILVWGGINRWVVYCFFKRNRLIFLRCKDFEFYNLIEVYSYFLLLGEVV